MPIDAVPSTFSTEHDFAALVEAFPLPGTFLGAVRHGEGHIHDTYAVWFREPDGSVRRWLLQRINGTIFREPDGLMANIEAVTRFLREKAAAEGLDPDRRTLRIVRTHAGTPLHRDAEGGCWRMCLFVEGARTYQLAKHPGHLREVGRAFGAFQRHLADFPAHTLHVTIPRFHDTPARYAAFEEAVARDAAGRAAGCAAEIAFARARAGETGHLIAAHAEGRVPMRVTHNDTKFNNVMIDDATGEGICVVDLDTVMPGLSLYDFGDAVRSGASAAEEDERDLSKVRLDLGLFEAFAAGFLETAGAALTPDEIGLLAFSPKLITFELGLRFLADHLNGDAYFRVHREGHNLDRARNQFALVADMEAKMPEMERIVDRLTERD